jgi:hypothetical protein
MILPPKTSAVCDEHVRVILMEAGTDCLEDLDLFGKIALSIIDRL